LRFKLGDCRRCGWDGRCAATAAWNPYARIPGYASPSKDPVSPSFVGVFAQQRLQTARTPMAIERTLSIIKPDAVAKNVIGQIYSRFEQAGLRIIAARMMHLSQAEAEAFYAVHRERPFFKDLVEFMTSGPVMVQVLEGESAITKNRDL